HDSLIAAPGSSCVQSIANQDNTVCSWSTNFSPETSTTTLSIVPPVNSKGAVYSDETGEALSRPTQMPSPTRQKLPGWVTISPAPTFSGWACRVSVPSGPGIAGG